jgi:predicted Zn-dependent protease
MHLPSRRHLKKQLSRKLIYSPFLRMVIFNVWFRAAVLCFLALAAFLAMFLPKIWLATPEGFLPEIRISWLDRAQAWSLRRTAAKFAAAKQTDDAEFAYRAAISNNPGDIELCRESLRSLLGAERAEAKHLSTAFSRALWLMRLSGTNAVDLGLASELLERFDLHEYQIRLLSPKLSELTPKEERALLKALFQTGAIGQFADRWKRASAEVRKDPSLALHQDAFLAGWGPPETLGEARNRLLAARSDPKMQVLANRLQLLVSAQYQDAAGYGAALDQLEQLRSDQLADHVRYWLLLLGSGRRAEAARLAEAYPHPPTTPGEVLRLADAFSRLGMSDTLRNFYQRYAPTFGNSAEVWGTYARFLVETKSWEELRSVAVQMRQHKGVGDAMASYCHFLEGRAELALGRPANAEQAFEASAKSRLDSPELRLEVGKGLHRLQYPRFARAVLWPAEKEFAKNTEYWSTVLQIAVELKEVEPLRKAAATLYQMQPENAQFLNSYAASLLVTREHPDEAIKLTLQLIAAYPDSVAARINHAFALLMNSRFDEALRLLSTIREDALGASDRNAYILARFEVHIALKQHEQAREYAGRLDPKQLFAPQLQRVEQLRSQLQPKGGGSA